VHIGIVGSGISGLSAAWLLSRRHNVTVFEKDGRLGGHSNTVRATVQGETIDVDTGFIVYNERNYPELTAFLDHLKVATAPSAMSFSASIGNGELEYCGSSPLGLFAQRRNLLRPAFYRMLADIVRFNRLGSAHLDIVDRGDWTLGRFLDSHGFGSAFRGAYLLPMAAAIWSCPTATMLHFPASSFLRFFANHGLLTVNDQPKWRTLEHRSKDYVDRLRASFAPRVRESAPVIAVHRRPGGVEVVDGRGGQFRFDAVVMAAHADQTAAVLLDADDEERRLLGAFRFQANRAVLHSDQRLMPRRRGAWAAWNYAATGLLEPGDRVSVTYWMNRLQNIDERWPLFVSMNPITEPDPSLVHSEHSYDHPIFDAEALAAQARMSAIQGRGGVYYAGAWLGHGFHEDGLRSGLEVAARLGVRAPWKPAPEVELPMPAASGLGLPEHAAAQPV
jgi:predicted NAD/FAD-binding protein